MTGVARKLNDLATPRLDGEGNINERTAWNHRILIVEDESAIADAYRDILGQRPGQVTSIRRSSRSQTPVSAESSTAQSSAGDVTKLPESFELTIVSSADKALAEVKHAIAMKKPYTMGFFDVLLGGDMDGIELVKKIHEIDPNLYAVFVTAYSDRSVDSIQGFLGEEHASRWDYLNKPFTRGEILQKARNGVMLWNLRLEKELKDERLASMQKQLRENERLSTIAMVARGIGHEFRNILTLIMGHAELGVAQARSHANDPISEKIKLSLEAVLKASNRAEEILQRFKFLANPSERVIIKNPIHLHKPIEEALMLMDHQIRENKVRVCWTRKKVLEVEANATSLIQVFVNLLVNSIHAMPSSGQIDISIAEVGDHAEVRFRDYGPGIPREHIDYILEPFYTTKGEKGTGLGLAICRDIVEVEHEGEFRIGNHEIKGVEVVMRFPLLGRNA